MTVIGPPFCFLLRFVRNTAAQKLNQKTVGEGVRGEGCAVPSKGAGIEETGVTSTTKCNPCVV